MLSAARRGGSRARGERQRSRGYRRGRRACLLVASLALTGTALAAVTGWTGWTRLSVERSSSMRHTALFRTRAGRDNLYVIVVTHSPGVPVGPAPRSSRLLDSCHRCTLMGRRPLYPGGGWPVFRRPVPVYATRAAVRSPTTSSASRARRSLTRTSSPRKVLGTFPSVSSASVRLFRFCATQGDRSRWPKLRVRPQLRGTAAATAVRVRHLDYQGTRLSSLEITAGSTAGDTIGSTAGEARRAYPRASYDLPGSLDLRGGVLWIGGRRHPAMTFVIDSKTSRISIDVPAPSSASSRFPALDNRDLRRLTCWVGASSG